MADSNPLSVPQPLTEFVSNSLIIMHPRASLLHVSLADVFLSGKGERAAEILRVIPLDGGLTCETFGSGTGLPVRGQHFATRAGFLGYAIYAWLKRQ